MYIILWEYTVKPGREAEFEKTYGPNGDWAQLFRQSDGYLGTDLVRATDTSPNYITIDHWVSSKTYEAFHKKYRAAYKALDVRCQSLTVREKLIGMGDLFSST